MAGEGADHVQRFSLGTYRPWVKPFEGHEEVGLLAESVLWLANQQHLPPVSRWGGPGNEDIFESTYHVCSTMLMLGIRPESPLLKPAVDWLAGLKRSEVNFRFWRAGTFLNLSGYDEIVKDELLYIWNRRRTFVGYEEYPAIIFLLKCSLFAWDVEVVPASIDEIVEHVVSQWDPENCWAGRTSITSMAFCLLRSCAFTNKETILDRSRRFLLDRFQLRDGRPSFDTNLVDDCYTVFNFCEQRRLLSQEPELASAIKECVGGLWEKRSELGYWVSPPPFQAESVISPNIQPTAVAIRSLTSYIYTNHGNVVPLLAQHVLEQAVARHGRIGPG